MKQPLSLSSTVPKGVNRPQTTDATRTPSSLGHRLRNFVKNLSNHSALAYKSVFACICYVWQYTSMEVYKFTLNHINGGESNCLCMKCSVRT